MSLTENLPAVITDADQALLDHYKGEFTEILTIVEKHMVTDEPSMEKATDMVFMVKKGLKAVEARRKEVVGPLNDQVKQINSAFNALKDQGNKVVGSNGILTRQMTSHMERLEREQRKADLERKRLEQEQLDREKAELEELEALGDEAAKTDLKVVEQKREDLATDRHSTPKPIARGQVGHSSMVLGKITIQIVDITKVPAKYLVVDEVKVRAAYQTGTRNIEGLIVKQERTLRTA